MRLRLTIPITARRTCGDISATPRSMALKVTGGSDFHGDNKPTVRLGAGERAYFAAGRTVALEPETVKRGYSWLRFVTMPIATTLPRAGE